MKNKPPIKANEVDAEWTDMVRSMIKMQGQPMRASLTGPSIELKSLTTNLWHPLMLPNSGTVFASTQDRDEVMRRLT
jgi:hypothetical protein